MLLRNLVMIRQTGDHFFFLDPEKFTLVHYLMLRTREMAAKIIFIQSEDQRSDRRLMITVNFVQDMLFITAC